MGNVYSSHTLKKSTLFLKLYLHFYIMCLCFLLFSDCHANTLPFLKTFCCSIIFSWFLISLISVFVFWNFILLLCIYYSPFSRLSIIWNYFYLHCFYFASCNLQSFIVIFLFSSKYLKYTLWFPPQVIQSSKF